MARRNRRRQRVPQDPVEAQIETLSHDGRGIARIEGKTVFVAGALTGETVKFLYTKKHSKYDEAKTIELIANPSSDRVEAQCQHFDICGGCSLMHMSADAQLSLKQNTLEQHLNHFGFTLHQRFSVFFLTKHHRVFVYD